MELELDRIDQKRWNGSCLAQLAKQKKKRNTKVETEFLEDEKEMAERDRQKRKMK